MDRAVSDDVIALLLTEGIWEAPREDGQRRSANTQYLRDLVFPTLVPALHELAELVQRQQDLGESARPSTCCVSRAHPTGASGPIEWLAQYLMRHNTKHSTALHDHPYVVLHRAMQQQVAQ